MQLVEVMPCLDKLPELLGRPYGPEDDACAATADQDVADADAGAAAGVDSDMDVDGPGAAEAGPRSSRQQGYLTLDALLDRVQVSSWLVGGRREQCPCQLAPVLMCALLTCVTAAC
jgi:hypothetical protein